MQIEIYTGNEHKESNDQSDRRALKCRDAVLSRTETARRDRRKGVADGFKEIHAGEPEQHDFTGGQSDIDQPQDLRGGGNARSDLGVGGLQAGRFRVIQHLTATVEHRQNRQRKHNDSHAAQPGFQRAPKNNAARQTLHAVRQHGPVRQMKTIVNQRRSGRRETGDGFEKCVVP